MTTDKNAHGGEEQEEQADTQFSSESSNRARNRTVMLTPDITGQVRAMLAKEMDQGGVVTEDPGFDMSGAGDVGSTYAPAPGAEFGVEDTAGFQPVQGASDIGSGQVAEAYAAEPPQAPSAAVAQPRAASPAPVAGYYHPACEASAPLIGFLISYDINPNGEVFELRQGRWIVSSEHTTAGNCIVLMDDSVSPLHAIMRVSGNAEIQLLDQLSEHGTAVTRADSGEREELTGVMATIGHGDVVEFGKLSFSVCVIPNRPEQE